MFKNYANEDTPIPSRKWISLTDNDRKTIVEKITNKNDSFKIVRISSANKNGKIYVSLVESISAATRGTLLLDYEEYIKKLIDESLTVWCEPLGDKSSLRNLRGIEIKS